MGTGIRRLVYSPRAYVFIKSKDGEIHDVSRYVTAGSVTRLIDQVSSAEITLRNPNHLFTVHVEDGEVVEPLFTPMDPITIFLRRVRNRPVRVFTGFLDKVPYLQLFPGTVTFQASCTIKRLLNTYFDPALPYTMSFLTTYGWVPYNGQWVSLTGMKEWLAPGSDAAATNGTGVTPAGPRDSGANSSASPAPLGAGDTNITVYGDSIGQGMAGALKKNKNLKVQENTKVGRPSSVGVSEIASLTKNFDSTVVIALGSNDDPTDPATFKKNVESILSSIGSNRHVIWVNLHGQSLSGHDLANLNSVLDDEASKHTNMTVLDWHQISADKNVNFDSQGLHTNSAGYQILADAVSSQIQSGATTVADGNKLQPPKNVDGSLSQLLFATLKHIGNWDSKDVYIEAMPEKLFDHLRDLATEFANDNKQAEEEMKTLFKNILGGSSQGSPTGSTGNGSDPTSSGDVKGLDKIIATIKSTADKYNVDAAMACAVCDIETGYGSNMFTHEPYHGWYQIDIGGSRYSSPISIAQANDLGYSCSLFCKGAAHTVPDSVKSDPLQWAMATQGVNGTNNPLYPSEWPTAYARAKKLISQYGNGPLSTPTGLGKLPPANPTSGSNSNSGEPSHVVQGSTTGATRGSPTAGKIYAPIKGGTSVPIGRGWHESSVGVTGETTTSGHLHWHSGLDVGVSAGTPCIAPVDGLITYSTLNWSDGGYVQFQFTEDVGNVKKGTTIGWGHIERSYVSSGQSVKAGETVALSGHPGGGDHVHFTVQSPGTGGPGVDGTTDPKPLFLALQKGDTASGSTPANSTGGGGSGNPGATQSDPTGQGTAAAGGFFASLDLPSMYDAVEASMLTGEKSLLNDKPLMPFIQQICSASLRHFQSLPDGRFYAFYPDYFGEMQQHPAYWEIDDIEILDGKIELTDDSLVTHMYVVGDTVNPMGGDTPFALRSVFSSGVVTIFNAFMADSVLNRDKARKKDKQAATRKANKHDVKKIEDDGMGIILDRQEAASFLNRYGARPAVEDMPMIRSPYYEMFLAYQKFLLAWSKQFSTPFAFTFMPELYPGGKVAFESHGLQMYIEQVNHTWDYEGGFTTSASLTAPSAYGKNTGLLPPNMVQAIIAPPTPSKASAGQNAD